MKKDKGITLVALVITIIVMSIIAGTVIFQAINMVQSQELNKLYNDLRTLEDKVNLYYTEYGGIPVSGEYTGPQAFQMVRNPNDSNKYYIININELENLTLNYNISNSGDDVYIINDVTHTIYYARGLEVNGKTYYRLPGEFAIINER